MKGIAFAGQKTLENSDQIPRSNRNQVSNRHDVFSVMLQTSLRKSVYVHTVFRMGNRETL